MSPYRDYFQAKLNQTEAQLKEVMAELSKEKRKVFKLAMEKEMNKRSIFQRWGWGGLAAMVGFVTLITCVISLVVGAMIPPNVRLTKQLNEQAVDFSCKEACVSTHDNIIATKTHILDEDMAYITCGCLSSKFNDYKKINISLIDFHYLWKK